MYIYPLHVKGPKHAKTANSFVSTCGHVGRASGGWLRRSWPDRRPEGNAPASMLSCLTHLPKSFGIGETAKSNLGQIA